MIFLPSSSVRLVLTSTATNPSLSILQMHLLAGNIGAQYRMLEHLPIFFTLALGGEIFPQPADDLRGGYSEQSSAPLICLENHSRLRVNHEDAVIGRVD